MAEAEPTPNGTEEPAPVAKPPEMVPASRLAEVVAERNALRKQYAEAAEQAGQAAEHRTVAERHAAELAAERAARAEERDLYRAGLLDEEAHVVARALYSAQPADSRPPSIGEYLTAFKADGAEVPRALRGYLGEPAKPPSPTATQPKPPANAGKPSPIGTPIGREAIEAAMKTGNAETIRATLDSFYASRGVKP